MELLNNRHIGVTISTVALLTYHNGVVISENLCFRDNVTVYFTLLPQTSVDYCFDTVEMMTAGGSGDSENGETHVLVPILSETGVSVVLESDLESDTHYNATLSFNSQPFTSTTFCEYTLSCGACLCVLMQVHIMTLYMCMYVDSAVYKIRFKILC